MLAFGSSLAGNDTVACGFATFGSMSIAGLGVCRIIEARRGALSMLNPVATFGGGLLYTGVCTGILAYMVGYDVPIPALAEKFPVLEDYIPKREKDQDMLMAAGSRD